MKIRFESTVEHMVAFNRFHYINSPTWRRQIRTLTLLLPLILAMFFAMVVLLMSAGDEPMDRAAWTGVSCIASVFLASSIGWAFFVRGFMYWSLARNIRKILAEGSNRAMLGWREMELVEGRLVVRTELLISSLDLRGIEKIVGNDVFTFVYTASVDAYTIPMNLYPEAEYRAFVAELREAWENRGIPTAPDARSAPRDVDDRIVKG